MRAKEHPKLSGRAANAEFVGWYDDQYIYLLSKVALRVVHKFYRNSGVWGSVPRYGARSEGEAEGAGIVVSGGE